MARDDGLGAIIVAAGSSHRMGGQDKVFASLRQRPLISYAVEAFLRLQEVVHVVLVLSEANIGRGRKVAAEMRWGPRLSLCTGGPRRRDSVWEGLKNLPSCQWVLVHDGARPLVTPEVIQRVLKVAQASGAATAAVPVKDTIKAVDQEGHVLSTPPRESLWAAQTPQAFRRELLEAAHRSLEGDFTDDASMVEKLGQTVKVALGSYDNIKVTTPEDLALAEAFLSRLLF